MSVKTAVKTLLNPGQTYPEFHSMRDMHVVEKLKQRTKKIIKGLGGLSYEDEAERAGIVQTGEEKAPFMLIHGYKYPRAGGWRRGWQTLFSATDWQ